MGVESGPTLQFRNYIPRTPELKEFCIAKPSIEHLEQEIDQAVKDAIETAKTERALLTIAPKKPNWDLKRDVDKRLDTLRNRTDKSIVKLIRKKIKHEAAEAKKRKQVAKEEEGETAFANAEDSRRLAREVANKKMEDFSDDE